MVLPPPSVTVMNSDHTRALVTPTGAVGVTFSFLFFFSSV